MRSELILLGVREYWRTFWWFILIVPVFGLGLLIFAQGPLQVIGYMGLVWPFSIPARAAIASAKSTRLFGPGCWMDGDAHEAVFYSADDVPKPLRFRLPYSDIRAVRNIGDLLVLQTRRFGSMPIKQNAFESPSAMEQFRSRVEAAIETRLSDAPEPVA
jgi:hypothetical protein